MRLSQALSLPLVCARPKHAVGCCERRWKLVAMLTSGLCRQCQVTLGLGWRRSLRTACMLMELRRRAGMRGVRSTSLRPQSAARRSLRCSRRVRSCTAQWRCFHASYLQVQPGASRTTARGLSSLAFIRAGAEEDRQPPWSAEAAADEFLQAHRAEAGPLVEYRKNRFSGVYRKVLHCKANHFCLSVLTGAGCCCLPSTPQVSATSMW